MKRILVLSFTDHATDPRVNRQIRFLKDDYDVVAAGTGDPGIPGVRYVDLRLPRFRKSAAQKALQLLWLLGGRFDDYYWNRGRIHRCLERIEGVEPDLIVANDIQALPLALRGRGRAKVLFDAHEFAPGEFENSLLWRIREQGMVRHLCRTCIPGADAMTTVCEGIAELYEAETGVRPRVITNAPPFADLTPRPLPPAGRPIRIVHHGAAIRARRLENMVRMMGSLDERFEMTFVLVESIPGYVDELKRLAARTSDRIRFLPPVPMPELPRFLNEYDVGVFLLEPTNVNYRLALPNKLFEFIQGRLAVAVGPSPEMARVVRETGCGVVSADYTPAGLARCLNALDAAAIGRLKERAHAAAALLCAEANRDAFLRLVRGLVGD